MEVDNFQTEGYPPKRLIVQEVAGSSETLIKNLGSFSFTGTNNKTIEILQTIEWFPYVGVWIMIKDIKGYDLDRFIFNVKPSITEPSTNSIISISPADMLLSEPLKTEGCRLWFAVLITSLPIILEVNTRENRASGSVVEERLSSTTEELYIYSPSTFGRKTLFHLSSPHISYTSMRLWSPLQLEHIMYFLSGLSSTWKIIPFTPRSRSTLIAGMFDSSLFSIEMCYPWYYAEATIEDPVFVFIPPIEDEENKNAGYELFKGKVYRYRGIMIMARSRKPLESIYNVLIKMIDNNGNQEGDDIEI